MDSTRAAHRGLMEELDACRELARDADRLGARDPAVSAWSVHEQVEHLLLADRGIVKWIGSVLDEPPLGVRTAEPTEWGRAVLASGTIPRGRGRAPEGTDPRGATPDELLEQLECLRTRGEALGDRLVEVDGCLHTLAHPTLGHYTPAEWLRFLHVHHLHHASIIDDILA